jgi:hypothetical protein
VGSGIYERANGLSGAAIFADHLADVVTSDVELDPRKAITRDFADFHLIGVIDERLRDESDEIDQHRGRGRGCGNHVPTTLLPVLPVLPPLPWLR